MARKPKRDEAVDTHYSFTADYPVSVMPDGYYVDATILHPTGNIAVNCPIENLEEVLREIKLNECG